MKEHPNFYENITEANMRLRGTVVLYDGIPHYVLAISAHNKDGIFRVYMETIGSKMLVNSDNVPPYSHYPSDSPETGDAMDKWMAKYKDPRLVRKMMNSPKFNKFRPFPLGMVNVGGYVYYTERQPTRKSEQGLTRSMITESRLTLIDRGPLAGRGAVDFISDAFRATVMGEYPSPQECLTNLLDPEVSNEGAAFHRMFAFMRGPVKTMFLAYKDQIIGTLPNNDLSSLRLSKTFFQCREAVEETGVFGSITVV